MVPTILDLLILIALRDTPVPIFLDQDFFKKYSQIITEIQGFGIVDKPGQKTWLLIAKLQDPFLTDFRKDHQQDIKKGQVAIFIKDRMRFKQYGNHIINTHEKNRILDLATYDFTLKRLSTHRAQIADIFFKKIPVSWDLSNDSCTIGGKVYQGQGLMWALDLMTACWKMAQDGHAYFSVSIKQENKNSHIITLQSEGMSEFYFKRTQPIDIAEKYKEKPKAPRDACLEAIYKNAQWMVSYGPLSMTTDGKWAYFRGYPIDLRRIDGKAQRLLWLCLETPPDKQPIAIRKAFGMVQNGRRYKPNNNYNSDAWQEQYTKHRDQAVTQKRIISRHIKTLENARDTIMKAIKQTCDTYHIWIDLKFTVSKDGVSFIIN